MASILDIVPHTETVSIEGTDIIVRGVGIDAIARALSIAPELADVMKPGGTQRLDASSLLIAAPMAIHIIIAEAAGTPDEATIKAVGCLPFWAQVDLVEAIIRLSFPDGIIPFVARLTGLLGDAPGARRNGAASGIVEPVSNGAPLLTN
jgi:hypothetical protein